MAWRGGLAALAAPLWVLLALGQGTASAAQPSFDCAAAAAPIELLICGHDDLAHADAELAALFRRLQDMPAVAPDLLAGQRLWLKSRLATCGIPATGTAAPGDPGTARCLLALYRDRIAVLTGLAADKQASAPPAKQTPPAEPGLDPRTLPATGERSAILSITAFGRYAVAVKSAQGVALQLVDRMTGPADVQGAAGESDGRIDAFLDRGQYKVLLHARDKGSGDAVLSARPFAELNGPEIPRLPEIRRVDTTLDDYQQRSYWLEIKERRLVAIEAAGRNLADLRLWRDGAWLVDAAPAAGELEPLPGRKLAVRRIVATLEPGLYRLSAYGGPGEAWATSSDEHPLHLRLGIPTLADAARETFTASPFGVDRYLVPGKATFFRLELPAAEAATLSVEKYDEKKPFPEGGSAAITKQSRLPVAELNGAEETEFKLVTVTREAGKPYLLQQFQAVSDYRFDGTGDYWLGTLHAGYGEDDIDATGVLTRRPKDGTDQLIRSNAPRLDAGTVWSRRFNLLDEATVFFQVTKAGRYVAAGSGVEATYRFEPIFPAGADYKAPDFQPSGHPWALDAGTYVLTVKPGTAGKGILDLRVAAEGVTGAGGDQAKETAVLFPAIHLDSGARYTLHLNQQPGVRAGVVLRRLPIDLRPGLPVTLKAGQSLDIPVTAPGDGFVTANAEDGQALGFAIDHHGAPLTKWRSGGGRHVLTLANPTGKALAAALRFTPDALAPDAPLPAVSPEALRAIPDFPALVAQQSRTFDIEKGEQRTFALEVDEPGLYRVESSGLLQTEGVMRTRTVVSLDSQANNGTGRNFLLQQYLGQGSYQVSVAAQGETHGHMGVAATRTLLVDGGALSPGIAARNTIAAGNGLLYSFTVPVAGRYRLEALGLGRTWQMRLEDAEGWPIVAPNAPADLTQDFAAGQYRLVILPQPVDARIVTLLAPVVEPAPIEGHGPHELALNQSVSYRWDEPAAGGTRTPDQWRFRLPAAAHATIDLGLGMVADLVSVPDGRAIERIEGGATWKRELPAGTYVLRATTREPNNRFDYTLQVAATELVAGESRIATLPADVPVSLGSDGVAEIGSFGTVDVRAWLYDQTGRLVASNDDRPNDWNFAITGRMRPGYYRLHVERVGSGGAVPAPAPSDAAQGDGNDQAGAENGEGGQAAADQSAADAGAQPGKTTISIYQAAEQQEPALAPGDTVLAGPNTHLVPLVTAAGDLLVASADGDGPAVGLGIEVEEGGTWRTLAEQAGRAPWVAVPVAGIAGPWRLRVWSVDRSTAPIRLQTRVAELQPAQAATLFGPGVPLRPVPGIAPPLGVAAVELEAAGALHLRQALPDLAWSTQKGRALAGDSAGIVFGDKGRLWFGARLADDTGLVAATRVVPTNEAVALTLPGAGDGAAIIAGAVAITAGPQLWLAESRLGDPGIGADGLTSVSSTESAVAIAADPVPSSAALRLWNAGDLQTPLPVTLRRIGFPAPVAQSLDWGVADRRISGRQALAFTLPPGLKRLRLALPPETAVLLRGGGTSEAIWSGRTALALSRDSNADRLLVLSTAATDAALGLSLAPLGDDAAPALGGGRIFKQYFAAAGVARLDVRLSASEKQAGARPRLLLAGAVRQATLLRDDGTLSRDAEPVLTGDARVDIAHGAGLVVGWIEGGDPLTSPDVTKATPVRTTSVLPLRGAAQQIDIAVDAPTFLHLRTTTPVIVQLPPAAGVQALRLFANGADLGLLLAKGTTPVVLRAAGEGDLAGLAEATLIDITLIGEGLGPAVRLAPGESRLYSFTVPDERDIGVGVRDMTDSARCRVLDAAGTVIGAGVVQLLHLKAGTYLLAVDAPADGTAIAIRPALVGVAAPDGSPPDEVKRGYLDLAGLKPENAR